MEPGAPARFLVSADFTRRPFRLMGAGLERLTWNLRLAGGLRTIPRGPEEPGLVRAKLSDGSAGLVVVPVQSGTLGLMNLSLRGDRHLGKSPLFVPLLMELMAELLEGGEGENARYAVSGRAFSLALPGRAVGEATSEFSRKSGRGKWNAIDDEGAEAQGVRLVGDEAGAFLVWSPAGRPGNYRVMREDEVMDVFAVGLPPEESNLDRLDAEIVRKRMVRGRNVRIEGSTAAGDTADPEREFWPILAALSILLLGIELTVLKAFRS
jgi:hypothetical protein